jgi:hypothetical protein
VFTPVVWWAGAALIAVLLYRGVRAHWAREYPIFFSYLAFIFIKTLVLMQLYRLSARAYSLGYWGTEIIATLVGVLITWELYEKMLAPYRGVRRMARALIGGLLAAVALQSSLALSARSFYSLMPTTAELQRNLRFVQALLLLAMLILVRYYRLRLGRNVAYLFSGYAMVVSTSMMNLALRSWLGDPFQIWWRVLSPLEYIFALGWWCKGLWTLSVSPTPNDELLHDYEAMSRQTSAGLMRLRARVEEALR